MGQREAAQAARGAAVERAIYRSAILRGVARIGARIFGTAAGALWPSDVATGVPTPAQVAEMEREAQREANRAGAPQLKRVEVKVERLIPPGTDPAVLQDVTVTRQRIGTTPKTTPKASPQASGSSTVPNPRTSRIRQSMLGRLPWAQIILGALLGPGRSTTTTLAPTTGTAPLTPTQPGLLPSGLSPPYYPPPPTRTANCECPPKRKSRKRKCLERGQVEWRTGRYKGKVAGTKCIRFASE